MHHGRLDLEVEVERQPEDSELQWLLLAGALAVAEAVRESAALPVEIDWPATLAVPGGMCGGSAGSRQLGEVTLESGSDRGSSHRLTIALRLDTAALDLTDATTSVAASGGRVDRDGLVALIHANVDRRVRQWRDASTELPADYRARCATIGRRMDGGWVSGLDVNGELVTSC